MDRPSAFVASSILKIPPCPSYLEGRRNQLDDAPGAVFHSFVWRGAAAGVVLKWLPGKRPGWVDGALYIALGWLALLSCRKFVAGAGAGAGAGVAAPLLLGVGGVLYTLGAAALATHRPDPWPRVFGYHEVLASRCRTSWRPMARPRRMKPERKRPRRRSWFDYSPEVFPSEYRLSPLLGSRSSTQIGR